LNRLNRFAAGIAVEFHPCGKCNLKCDHCVFGELLKANKPFALTKEEILTTIDGIHEFAVTHNVDPGEVELKFGGIFSEPLHHQTKSSVAVGIDRAVGYGFKVGLTTNGMNMDQEVAQALAKDDGKSANNVNLSLDSGTWQTLKAIKLPKATDAKVEHIFNQTVENLKRLTALRKQHNAGVGVHISYVIQSRNIGPEDLRKAVAIAHDTDVDSIRFRHTNRKSAVSPTAHQLKTFYQTMNEIRDEYGDSDLQIAILGDLDVAIKELHQVGTRHEQPKYYKICRVTQLRTAIGADGGIYPCEHRCFKGGGILGNIHDGFSKVREGEQMQQVLSEINPSVDPQCQYCSQYNHHVNVLMDIIAMEFDRDPNVFEWLEQQYLSENLNLEGQEDGFKAQQDMISKAIQRSSELGYAALHLLSDHLNRLASDDLARRDVARFVNRDAVYLEFPARVTSSDVSCLYCSIYQRGDIEKNEMSGFFGYKIGGDYNPDYFLRTVLRDTELLSLLWLLSFSASGRRRLSVVEQVHMRPYVRTQMKALTDSDDVLDYLTTNYIELLDLILSLAYPYYGADVKHLLLLHFPFLVRTRLRDIHDGAVAVGFDGDAVSFSRFYKFGTDLIMGCCAVQLDFLRDGYVRHLGTQCYIALEIMQRAYTEFVNDEGLRHPIPVLLLRDAEPLMHIFAGLISDLGVRPELVNFNRISTMTDSEQERFAELGLGQRNEYAQILFGRQSKIFLEILPFDTQIASNHLMAEQAEKMVRQWLHEEWKQAMITLDSQERLGRIAAWENRFQRVLRRTWLICMACEVNRIQQFPLQNDLRYLNH